MENAYIYTRVSTLIQVDGFSLEAQEAEIRAFAEARKINIVGKYTDGKRFVKGRLPQLYLF